MLNPYLKSSIQVNKNDHLFIHCPEIVDFYHGTIDEDEYLNKQYDFIKCKRTEAFMTGNLEGFILLTTRPYRLGALLEVIAENKHEEETLAQLLLHVWMDTEHPSTNYETWHTLFSRFKECHCFTKTKDCLPNRFKIWRGGSANSLSWTLDELIARWFANRFNKNPKIHCREIIKEEAICYLDARGEKEVILLDLEK